MYYLVILGWKGNMSFSKFYGAYDFNTFYIDKCIKCEKEQLKYYNLWCEKYNKCFSKCTTDGVGEIERYNVFNVIMVIRHAKDGKMYLYDIMNIKKETSTLFQSEDITQ